MPRAAGHVHRGREAAAQQGPSALHLHWWRSTELFRGQQPSVPAEFAVKTCSRPWSRCAVAGVCALTLAECNHGRRGACGGGGWRLPFHFFGGTVRVRLSQQSLHGGLCDVGGSSSVSNTGRSVLGLQSSQKRSTAKNVTASLGGIKPGAQRGALDRGANAQTRAWPKSKLKRRLYALSQRRFQGTLKLAPHALTRFADIPGSAP